MPVGGAEESGEGEAEGVVGSVGAAGGSALEPAVVRSLIGPQAGATVSIQVTQQESTTNH